MSPDVLEDAMILKSDLNSFNDIVNLVSTKDQEEDEISEFDLKKQKLIQMYNGK